MCEWLLLNDHLQNLLKAAAMKGTLEDLKEADENGNDEVQTNIEPFNTKYAYSSFCLRMSKCQRRKDQDLVWKTHRLQKLILTIAASLIPRLIVTLFYSRIFYVFIQMYPRECPSEFIEKRRSLSYFSNRP